MGRNWRMAHLEKVGAPGNNTAMELYTCREKEELSQVMDRPQGVGDRMTCKMRVGVKEMQTSNMEHAYLELYTCSEKEELSHVMDRPGVVMDRITCRVVMKEMQTSIMLHAYLDWNTASTIIDSLMDMGSGERE